MKSNMAIERRILIPLQKLFFLVYVLHQSIQDFWVIRNEFYSDIIKSKFEAPVIRYKQVYQCARLEYIQVGNLPAYIFQSYSRSCSRVPSPTLERRTTYWNILLRIHSTMHLYSFAGRIAIS